MDPDAVALARPERQRAEWRKNEEDPVFAETFPFYERLIGTDGSLWVECARRTEDEGCRYVVYDSSAIATVQCPDRVGWVHLTSHVSPLTFRTDSPATVKSG
jgi:hypothetical protein